MRFTIRDLLWLLVVAGLAVGWGVDRFKARSAASHLIELLRRDGHDIVLKDDWTIQQTKVETQVVEPSN